MITDYRFLSETAIGTTNVKINNGDYDDYIGGISLNGDQSVHTDKFRYRF